SHDDINDWSQAEYYFQLAISTTSDPIDRGIATRGYGRYLYGHGRLKEAREQYTEALECFNGSDDRVRVFRADTFVRWSRHERDWTSKSEANRLLEEAIQEYEQLTNPGQRRNEVTPVRELLSPVKLYV